MAVSLTKGQKVNLSKAVEKLANVTVGLGWDMAQNGNSIRCTALIVGELYRDENNEWQFKAIGEGTHDSSIPDMAKRYK